MFHCLANFIALANVANTDTPAVNDSIMMIQNGHHVPPKNMQLMAAYAGTVTLLRARLNSPKVRQVSPSYIKPVGAAVLPGNLPQVADFRSNPFMLNGQEEIIWELTDSAAGPNNAYVISIVQDGFTPAPRGDIYTIRATSTTTTIAATWVPVTLTWDTQLPAGVYSVIGAQCISATSIAFSLTFDNQFYRPGFLCGINASNIPWEGQRYGGLGEWGRFDTVTLPRCQILSDVAVAAHEVLLDVVRVR